MKISKIAAFAIFSLAFVACGGPESVGKDAYKLSKECDTYKKRKSEYCIEKSKEIQERMRELSEDDQRIAFEATVDAMYDDLEDAALDSLDDIDAPDGEKDLFMSILKSQRESAKHSFRPVR